MIHLLKKLLLISVLQLGLITSVFASYDLRGNGPNVATPADNASVKCLLYSPSGVVIGYALSLFDQTGVGHHVIKIPGGTLSVTFGPGTDLLPGTVATNPPSTPFDAVSAKAFPDLAAKYPNLVGKPGVVLYTAVGDHRFKGVLNDDIREWTGTGVLKKAKGLVVRCIFLVDNGVIVACVNCMYHIDTDDNPNN